MATLIVGETGAATSDPAAAWLLDALDDHIVRAEVPRYRPGWFSASELGEPDDVLIARYRGVWAPEPHTARELRIFHNGSNRDAAYKAYLQDSGLSVIGEESARDVVVSWLRLRGSLDDIVRNPATGEMWVVEFKTMNPFSYGRLQEPKEAHRLQVTAYMAATSIPRAIVLYENKGDQATRAFAVEFDRALWDDIVTRLQRLRAEAEVMDAGVGADVLVASRNLAQELAGRPQLEVVG